MVCRGCVVQTPPVCKQAGEDVVVAENKPVASLASGYVLVTRDKAFSNVGCGLKLDDWSL